MNPDTIQFAPVKEYRSLNQWNDILDAIENGNWTQAANKVVEYGFYASDLVDFYRDDLDNAEGDQDLYFLDEIDLVLLIESATIIRMKQ